MSTPPPPQYSPLFAAIAAIGSGHYLHILFHANAGRAGLEASLAAQRIIDTADDWLRYAFNCWIVWTPETPEQWYQKLKVVPSMAATSVFIIKVELSPSNRSGQFPPWCWDWINRSRT